MFCELSFGPHFFAKTRQLFYICPRLASPIWVGWAKIHTKTLLDVYLLSSNFANLVLKEDTATGTSISVMTIQSLRYRRGVSAYHPLTWASCVAYPLSRQRRPDDGMSKSKTPTSFFVIK